MGRTVRTFRLREIWWGLGCRFGMMNLKYYYLTYSVNSPQRRYPVFIVFHLCNQHVRPLPYKALKASAFVSFGCSFLTMAEYLFKNNWIRDGGRRDHFGLLLAYSISRCCSSDSKKGAPKCLTTILKSCRLH